MSIGNRVHVVARGLATFDAGGYKQHELLGGAWVPLKSYPHKQNVTIVRIDSAGVYAYVQTDDGRLWVDAVGFWALTDELIQG